MDADLLNSLLKTFTVKVTKEGSTFGFIVKLTYGNGGTDEMVLPVTFLSQAEAFNAGVIAAYRECVVSQLREVLYDWLDSNLITDEEFTTAESALSDTNF